MGVERHFRPRPLPENPRGFYEDYRFRRINDGILHRNGYEVESWIVPPPISRDSVILLARRLFLLFRCEQRSAAWGWKDPRTCLTFDLWASALRRLRRLNETHVVLVIRDPRAVSASLQRRNGLSLGRGLELWHEYNRRALASLDTSGVPVTVVDFARLVQHPLVISNELARRFSGLDPRAAAEFVDPSHARSFSAIAAGRLREEDNEAQHPAIELFESLRSDAI